MRNSLKAGSTWLLILAAFIGCGAVSAQSISSNPLHLSFHHVTASVADLEKEASWYERVLGFHKSALLGDSDELRAYHMTRPGLRIDLVRQKGSVRQHGAKGASEQGWVHIVFTDSDLDAAYRYLLSLGTDVRRDGDKGSSIHHLTLHDPEGNEIGIAND